MRVTSTDLSDRLVVQVDPDATPADVDQAVAKFLLAFVKSQLRTTPVTPAAAVVFTTTPERKGNEHVFSAAY
jgi:hypothetical protein